MKKTITILMLFTTFFITASKKDTTNSLEKKAPKRDLLKELLSADLTKKSPKSEGVKDITGLAFKTGSSASIPEKYREVAIEYNWNPITMTQDEMEEEYNLILRNKYLRGIYIVLGITSLVFSLVFIRNFTNKSIIMKMHFIDKFKGLSKGLLRKYIVISCLIPVSSFVLFYIFKSINGYGDMYSQTYYFLSELFFFLFFFGIFIFWGIIRIMIWVLDGHKEDLNEGIS